MIGMLTFGFGGMAYNITQVSLRQAITPERLQGRMNASMRWIVWGTIPLGTLTGGALGGAYGLRTALWVGAIGGLFTFLPVLLSSVRSIRDMPEPVVEATPGAAAARGLVEPTTAPLAVGNVELPFRHARAAGDGGVASPARPTPSRRSRSRRQVPRTSRR